jgi:hypothetical protein
MNRRESAFRERSHGSQVLSYREKKEEPMLAESNLSFESRREFQASYQFHFIINPVFKVFPDLIYQSHFHMKERRNKIVRGKTLECMALNTPFFSVCCILFAGSFLILLYVCINNSAVHFSSSLSADCCHATCDNRQPRNQ